MESYNTLIEAINGLKAKGYTEDFNLRENHIDCHDGQYQLSPDEFKVDAVFRFEDNTDPDDQSVVYAISSEKHKLKGLLVNSYGIYSDAAANELIKKLQISHHS
jgi:hypothetical protein